MSSTDNTPDRQILIPQLWRTWSGIGIDMAGGGGMRIRAASSELQDLNSDRMLALTPYLFYELPQDADPSTVKIDDAPVCLSLLSIEYTSHKGHHFHERILVNKVYIGKDGRGRDGNYFVHMLAGLPPFVSALDTLLLWRSNFWQFSDLPIREQDTSLAPVHLEELRNDWKAPEGRLYLGLSKRGKIERVYKHLPFVIQAYLLQWRKRELHALEIAIVSLEIQRIRQKIQEKEKANFKKEVKGYIKELQQMEQHLEDLKNTLFQHLYIAAPPDEIVFFILELIRCLPAQFTDQLTFSTYEANVSSKHLHKNQCLIIGTSSLHEQSYTTHDLLPALCYEQEFALNCYTEKKTQLDAHAREASIAQRIAELLEDEAPTVSSHVTPVTSLSVEGYAPEETLSAFRLRLERSLNERHTQLDSQDAADELGIDLFLREAEDTFLDHELTQEEIEQLFSSIAAALQSLKVSWKRKRIIDKIVEDPIWFKGLREQIQGLKSPRQNPHYLEFIQKLSALASTLVKHIVDEVRQQDVRVYSHFVAAFDLLPFFYDTSRDQLIWKQLLESLFDETQQTSSIIVRAFIHTHKDIRDTLLEAAIGVQENLSINTIKPLLDEVEEIDFVTQLPWLSIAPQEWVKYLTDAFLKRSPWQDATLHALEQHKDEVKTFVEHFLRPLEDHTVWSQAKAFFSGVVLREPLKETLLRVFLNQRINHIQLKELFTSAQLIGPTQTPLSFKEEILKEYGKSYMQQSEETAHIFITLFQDVVNAGSSQKLIILFVLLNNLISKALMEEVLTIAPWTGEESRIFFDHYDPAYDRSQYPDYVSHYPDSNALESMFNLAAQELPNTLGNKEYKNKVTLLCRWLKLVDSTKARTLLTLARLSTNERVIALQDYGPVYLSSKLEEKASLVIDQFGLVVKEGSTQSKAVLFTLLNTKPRPENTIIEHLLILADLIGNDRDEFLHKYGKIFVPFCYQSPTVLRLFQSMAEDANRRTSNTLPGIKLNLLESWLPKQLSQAEVEKVLEASLLQPGEAEYILEKEGSRYLIMYPTSPVLVRLVEHYLFNFYIDGFERRASTLAFLKSLTTLSGKLPSTLMSTVQNLLDVGLFLNNPSIKKIAFLPVGHAIYSISKNISSQTYTAFMHYIVLSLASCIHQTIALSQVLNWIETSLPQEARDKLFRTLLIDMAIEAGRLYKEQEKAKRREHPEDLLIPYIKLIPLLDDYYLGFSLKDVVVETWNALLDAPYTSSETFALINKQLSQDKDIDKRVLDKWEDYERRYNINKKRQASPVQVSQLVLSTQEQPIPQPAQAIAALEPSKPYQTIPVTQPNEQVPSPESTKGVPTPKAEPSKRQPNPFKVIWAVMSMWLELRLGSTKYITEAWQKHHAILIKNQHLLSRGQWEKLRLARNFHVATQMVIESRNPMSAEYKRRESAEALLQTHEEIKKAKSEKKLIPKLERAEKNLVMDADFFVKGKDNEH